MTVTWKVATNKYHHIKFTNKNTNKKIYKHNVSSFLVFKFSLTYYIFYKHKVLFSYSNST